MAEIVEHKLGVWLTMRHADHIADAGLGYSSLKDLYLSAVEWWNDSPHNPLREVQVDTVAFKRGAALHAHVLDGLRVYRRVYGIRPTLASHPDHLDGVRDLMAACAKARLPTTGLKAELIDRLVRSRAKVKILEVAQEKWDRSGKTPIAERDDIRIKILYAMMMRSREQLRLTGTDTLTIRDALRGALTETSVFWVDEAGVRQRARFDALKPNLTLDLKSIAGWRKGNFKKALLSEMIYRGYVLQAAHYHEGRKALQIAVDEGRVFGGNKTQRKRLERVAEAETWVWANLFAKMDGAPQVRAVVVRPESPQFIKAQAQREEALINYIWHREFHGGVENPWFDPDTVYEPDDNDWPPFSVLGDA